MGVWVEKRVEAFANLKEWIPEGVYEGIEADDADGSEKIDASQLQCLFTEVLCVFVLSCNALTRMCGLIPGEKEIDWFLRVG